MLNTITTVKLKSKDLLIIDPCYIKRVGIYWNSEYEERFDALKHVKTLLEGDDGYYFININGNRHKLGVDSGRIWILQAEFECDVALEVDLSGCILIPSDEAPSVDKNDKVQ